MFVYLYTRSRFNQFRNDIKSKNPEDYSTVDKVGREKLSTRKSCFV